MYGGHMWYGYSSSETYHLLDWCRRGATWRTSPAYNWTSSGSSKSKTYNRKYTINVWSLKKYLESIYLNKNSTCTLKRSGKRLQTWQSKNLIWIPSRQGTKLIPVKQAGYCQKAWLKWGGFSILIKIVFFSPKVKKYIKWGWFFNSWFIYMR